MLALETMSFEIQAILYAIAVVCFVLAAFSFSAWPKSSIGWLGLAFAFFPTFWNAAAAA